MSDIPIMVIIIFSILIMMLPIVYTVAKGQIGQPIVIIWSAAFLSLGFSIYGGITFGWDIHVRTFFIVILGLLGMLMGAIGANLFRIQMKVPCKIYKKKKFLSFQKQLVMMGFYSFMTVLMIANIKQLTGMSTWNPVNLSKEYRSLYLADEVTLSFIVRQLYRVERVLSFYLLSILLEHSLKDVLKKYIMTIVGIFCFMIQGIATGSRNDILYMFLAGIAMFLVHFYRRNSQAFLIPRKVFMIVALGIVVLLMFTYTQALFGRSGQYSALIYAFKYLGGSLFSLNQFVIRNSGSNYAGVTFSGILRGIYDYLSIDGKIYTFEHQWIDGIYNGNTYTMFAKYYYDAGIAGVILFSGFVSFFMTMWYRRLVTGNYENRYRISLSLYGYMSSSLFLVLYDEHFLSTKLCFGLITDILALFVIDFFITSVFFCGKTLQIVIPSSVS